MTDKHDSLHVQESDDVGASFQGASASKQYHRVEATETMKKMVSGSMRDMLTGYPLLASFASSDAVFYHAVSDKELPLALTDGAAIYFNTAKDGWFDGSKWNADERVFVHAHEVVHLMREDCLNAAIAKMTGTVTVPRTPAFPEGRLPYKEELYQCAMDAIINSALLADKVGKMPAGGFVHPAITHHMTTGEAYAVLWEEDQQNQQNQPQQNQQSQSQGGSNPGGGGNQPPPPSPPNSPAPNAKDPMAGDARKPGSMGDPQGDSSDEASQPRDPAQAIKDLQKGAADRAMARERAESMARQQGAGTSHVEAMVKRATAPGVDWRSYFKGFLARAAGNSAYNWQRPSRPPLLHSEPYFSPSRAGHGANHIVWVGDTSGSIQEAEHRKALAALVEMLGDINPRTLSVVWCDSAVQRVDVFTGGVTSDAVDDFYSRNHIPRGGGTDFSPPFEMLASISQGGSEHVPADMDSHLLSDLLDAGEPDGLAYFTDLCGSAPEEAPPYPVLWVATNLHAKHPWGGRVNVDPQEL
jgi:hypothetical protein